MVSGLWFNEIEKSGVKKFLLVLDPQSEGRRTEGRKKLKGQELCPSQGAAIVEALRAY